MTLKMLEGGTPFGFGMLKGNKAYSVAMNDKVVVVTTGDYEKLKNKPHINGVELSGDLTTEDLLIEAESNIEHLVDGGKVGSLRTSTAAAEGNGYALGEAAFAEGYGTRASGDASHAEGANTQAIGAESHTEGYSTCASGIAAHAEGVNTQASGEESHAEGLYAVASGQFAHAEGLGGNFSIGSSTYTSGATGTADHAEGYRTMTRNGDGGPGNHAEGYQTIATGGAAHSEGRETQASGAWSHAEGYGSVAGGAYSHAEGRSTTAKHLAQHVFGSYNVEDPSNSNAYQRGNYVEIVGNGEDSSHKSNARTLDWEGNEVLAGGLTTGGSITIGNTTITEGQLQALLALLT